MVIDFFSRSLNVYEITFVDNNDVTNRATFQPIVTSTFAKKTKKILHFFIFCICLFFDPPIALKIQI